MRYALITLALLLLAVPIALAQDADLDAALLAAVDRADATEVEHLLAAGADPNLQDEYGWAMLRKATDRGQDDIVELLLAAGADVNLQSGYAFTALTSAAWNGHIDVVRLLLAAGADVNLRTDDERLAAQLAWEYGYHDIARIIEQAIPYGEMGLINAVRGQRSLRNSAVTGSRRGHQPTG